MSLPNLLTVSRFVLAPWVALSILHHEYRAAFWLLVAAGATDGLDGFLARRCGLVTRLGAQLDPVADKVLLATVYLSLVPARIVPLWLVILIVARDLLILSFAAVALAARRKAEFAPSVWGKLSTVVQVVTGAVAIWDKAFTLPGGAPWLAVLVTVTAATTGWSGLHYAWRGVRMMRGQSRDGAIDEAGPRE
ncbi:MAG: CDP-alcohol phosphatidyltransferase family protein [Bryobacteraceae bacterium]